VCYNIGKPPTQRSLPWRKNTIALVIFAGKLFTEFPLVLMTIQCALMRVEINISVTIGLLFGKVA
jgi:hypothetical protein